MTIKELDLTYRDTGIPFIKDTLTSPEDVVAYMRGAFDSRPEQEQFWAVLLDRRNHPLGRILCTLGTASRCLVHPREIFRAAIVKAASAVVVVHNHPAGDPSPSSDDEQVTRLLSTAAATIDIDLVDHIIIGEPELDPEGVGFYSFFHGEAEEA